MRIGLIAMSGVRVRTRELAELGVTLPGFVNRGRVIASLPSLGLLTVAALTPPRCGGRLPGDPGCSPGGCVGTVRPRRHFLVHRADR